MIERLRSHRKEISSQKGFTLVELLVVIAILAVLILIVIVAINPLEQIKKANDRRWESLIRNTATATQACITDQLGKGTADTVIYVVTTGCASNTSGGLLKSGGYVPANTDISKVTFAVNGTTSICGYVDTGANGGHKSTDAGYTGYTSFSTSSGTTAPATSGTTTCT